MTLRRLLLSILVLAPLALHAAGWEQVTLFDWVYPGETAYSALQKGAQQSGSRHWLVGRLSRGEKLPQASARDLAAELMENPAVDAETKAVLKDKLSSEAAQLGVGSQSGALGKAEELSQSLDAAGRRMDEIELTYKTNNVGKGSTPSLGMDIYTGYRVDNPGGALQRRARANMMGGARYQVITNIDKVTVSVGLGVEYDAGDSTSRTTSDRISSLNAQAAFQVPLDNGGLDVHLGDKQQVFLSPLLFGTLIQEGREIFFVDVTKAFRPPRVVKLLDLEYPAFSKEIHALYVVRQGQAWYWPFSRTQFVLTPNDNDYWEIWNEKVYTSALRLDREIHPNRFMDPGLYYLLWLGSTQDTDIYRGTSVPVRPRETVEAYGAGLELHFVPGTQLKAEAALSNYNRELVIGGPQRMDSDTAAIGTLVQPLGPFNLALEAGMAGPRFLSSPQRADRILNGATMNSMDKIPWPNTDPTGLAWVSFMKDTSVMTNNQTRLALKAEWHAGWFAIGIYEGILSQINPTDARVVMVPVIEGRDDSGHGLFRMFGQNYAVPAAPPPAGSSGQPGVDAQYAFNRPTTGAARYGPGAGTINVNWQEISQQSYREVFFSTWLTQNGPGDNRLLDPVVKTYNYLGSRMVLDFGALFSRTLASQLTVVGELRDLALQPGVPSLDASNLFSQNYGQAVYEHGVTEIVTVVAKAAFETWKSNRNFYPLDMQVAEFGAGFDLRLDPYVSGLQLNARGTALQFDDLNRPGRAFSLTTLSVGTTLTY